MPNDRRRKAIEARRARRLKRLFRILQKIDDDALCLSALGHRILDTEEAAELIAYTDDAWNAAAKRVLAPHGIKITILEDGRIAGTSEADLVRAISILTSDDMLEVGPDGWLGVFLLGAIRSAISPVRDEHRFRQFAKREWERRLRKTVRGQAIKQAVTENERNRTLAEDQQKQLRADVFRLDRELGRQIRQDPSCNDVQVGRTFMPKVTATARLVHRKD
jgi:hypothetical protein